MNPIVRQELDAIEKRLKFLYRTIEHLSERNTVLHVAIRNLLDGKPNAEKEAQSILMDMSWRVEE